MPIGRAEPLKLHIVLLWRLLQDSGFFLDEFGILIENPIEHLQGCFSISSSNTHIFQKGDLAKNLLHPATLEKVDEWFNNLQTEEDGVESDTSFGPSLQNIIANSQLLPVWFHWGLKDNERDLDPRWTEIEAAISNIQTASSHSTSDPKGPFHPASWICAVILLTVVKSVGFGSLSSYIFNQTLFKTIIGEILGLALPPLAFPLLAPPPLESPSTQKFQNALKKSGHTCWSQKSCGYYSMADLYSSAYSMLLDTSHVPVVGCDQPSWRKAEFCAVCCTNNTFQNLSNLDFLDSVDLTKAAFLNVSKQERKLRKSAKRLIYKLVS